MRPHLLLGLLTSLLFGLVSAQEHPRTFRPLDLPSGGKGVVFDEEDYPESIQFFGSIYEGDGFFFLLDKSGSMAGMKMDLLKAEMSSALSELSSESEFGIVAFSGTTISFSPIPTVASAEAVDQARLWVIGLVANGPTMMLSAANELLTIAQISQRSHRSVIAVGDGLPNSPGPVETLEGILLINTEQLPCHTILFGSDAQAIQFMSELASFTGGTFRSIEF